MRETATVRRDVYSLAAAVAPSSQCLLGCPVAAPFPDARLLWRGAFYEPSLLVSVAAGLAEKGPLIVLTNPMAPGRAIGVAGFTAARLYYKTRGSLH